MIFKMESLEFRLRARKRNKKKKKKKPKTETKIKRRRRNSTQFENRIEKTVVGIVSCGGEKVAESSFRVVISMFVGGSVWADLCALA
jgi:C4-dicarboxylate-specific signal transduction histidine kinase